MQDKSCWKPSIIWMIITCSDPIKAVSLWMYVLLVYGRKSTNMASQRSLQTSFCQEIHNFKASGAQCSMNLNMFVCGQCLSCILLSVVVSSVMSSFVLSHSCLSALEPPCPLPPCPQNSNEKYPHALRFSVQRTILVLGIPKSPLWYRLSAPLTVGSSFQISWSPDSKFLLSASADKTAKIWDIAANTCST